MLICVDCERGSQTTPTTTDTGATTMTNNREKTIDEMTATERAECAAKYLDLIVTGDKMEAAIDERAAMYAELFGGETSRAQIRAEIERTNNEYRAIAARLLAK